MTQRDLNRAIAKATGESVSEIEHIGFSEIVVPDEMGDLGDRRKPAIVDWDALDQILASQDLDAEPPLLLVA